MGLLGKFIKKKVDANKKILYLNDFDQEDQNIKELKALISRPLKVFIYGQPKEVTFEMLIHRGSEVPPASTIKNILDTISRNSEKDFKKIEKTICSNLKELVEGPNNVKLPPLESFKDFSNYGIVIVTDTYIEVKDGNIMIPFQVTANHKYLTLGEDPGVVYNGTKLSDHLEFLN